VSDSADGVHVIPVDDLVIHTESSNCFCGPATTWVSNECCGKMSVKRLVNHVAMDGRE
jgi:hypothetical protein